MTKQWTVLLAGDEPEQRTAPALLTCTQCKEESSLMVSGVPIAQVGDGIVFDGGYHWMPKIIRCPHCLRTLELEAAK